MKLFTTEEPLKVLKQFTEDIQQIGVEIRERLEIVREKNEKYCFQKYSLVGSLRIFATRKRSLSHRYVTPVFFQVSALATEFALTTSFKCCS